MVNDGLTDEEDSDLRYSVRLLIRRPNIDPNLITEHLGLTPDDFVIAGSERRTPKGDLLPGKHRMSAWSHSFRTERHRHFFSDVERMIGILEPQKSFLVHLVDGGGFVDLIVDMPGDVNLGSSLGWRAMARLADLRIDLGIEVFPHMR
jgi:hypothetical protein